MFGSHKVRATFINSHPTVVGYDASIPESERLPEKPTSTEPTNDRPIQAPEFTSPFAIAQRVADGDQQPELLAQVEFSNILDAYLSVDSIVPDSVVFKGLRNYLLSHGAGNPDGVALEEALEFTGMLAVCLGNKEKPINPLSNLDVVSPSEAVEIVRTNLGIDIADQQITLGQETVAWVQLIYDPSRAIDAQAGTIG